MHGTALQPEGGDPYLGTIWTVLGDVFFRTWIVHGYGLGVLGHGLGRTWLRFGSYLGAAWLGRTSLGCGLNTATSS